MIGITQLRPAMISV